MRRTKAWTTHLGSGNLCFPWESSPWGARELGERAALGLCSPACWRRGWVKAGGSGCQAELCQEWGPAGLGPHPSPVHSWSSAIHEFSCCSSPTSKMMSVRSFTWWGGRVWLCGTPAVCMCDPRVWKAVTHFQHEGVEIVGHLEACAPPDLLDAGAGCLELGLGTLGDQGGAVKARPCWPFAPPGLCFSATSPGA